MAFFFINSIFWMMISIEKYWNLIRKLDQYEKEWSSSPPFSLSCEPGCDECCQARFTLFAVEVAAISRSLENPEELDPEKRGFKNNGACPMLHESKCLIYPVRPILCRTQGFPFVYQNEQGQMASDICFHNRTGLEISLPAKYVLNLETLNHCLSSLNYLYLAEMEEEDTIVPARLDILHILDYHKVREGH